MCTFRKWAQLFASVYKDTNRRALLPLTLSDTNTHTPQTFSITSLQKTLGKEGVFCARLLFHQSIMHLWGKAATNLKIYEEPQHRVHKHGSISEKETENDGETEGEKEKERKSKRNKTGASRVLKSQTVQLNCCFSANKY